MMDDQWLDEPLTVPIRQMTSEGVERFRSYLLEIKSGVAEPLPPDLITHDKCARILDHRVTVEAGVFETALDMARYLHPRIDALTLKGKYYDPGLWSWLTAFYFDCVCPFDTTGRRKVGEMVRYIPPSARDFRDSNRHLLSAPLRMFGSHGENRMMLFLYTRPHEKSDFLRQIMETQELSANRGLLDALHILYWDNDRQRPKRGSAKSSPGALIRFLAVMNQFNRTFDLLAMTGEQIIELLPKEEFGRWLSHKNRAS